MQRKGPFEEVTSEDNEPLLGTSTPKGWGAFHHANYLVRLLGLDDLEQVLHEARRSSGSIGGEHRRDIVAAIQGAQTPKQGLAMPTVTFQADPPPEGHNGRRRLLG